MSFLTKISFLIESLRLGKKHKHIIGEANKEKRMEEEVKKEEVTEEKKPVDEATPDKKGEEETAPEKGEEQQPEQVEQVAPVGNGIRVEDLVTRDEVHEMLSAFEAKLAAITKENADLKEKLAQAQGEAKDLHEKYEEKDFGGYQKQGMSAKDSSMGSSFDDYCKQFM